MTNKTLALLCCSIVCGSAPLAAQATPASATPIPVITLPPDLDRVLRDYERDWRAKSATGLAALFTEDGFVLSDRKPPVRGRSNIVTAYTGSGGPLTLAALGYATGDTVGYIVGSYGSGDASTHGGKFVLALRRAPGGPWLIAADIENRNSR